MSLLYYMKPIYWPILSEPIPVPPPPKPKPRKKKKQEFQIIDTWSGPSAKEVAISFVNGVNEAKVQAILEARNAADALRREEEKRFAEWERVERIRRRREEAMGAYLANERRREALFAKRSELTNARKQRRGEKSLMFLSELIDMFDEMDGII